MTRYLERAGHLNLLDGSVLRLDFECRRWCASYYQYTVVAPHLTLRAYMFGDFDAMRAQIVTWADAFEASLTSPVGGVESSAPVGIPGVEQPLGGVA